MSQNQKILIIDRNIEYRDILKMELAKFGYIIDSITTDLLEHMINGQNNFDQYKVIIVCDGHGFHGSAKNQILSLKKHIIDNHIVLITNFLNSKERIEAYNIGVDDCFAKNTEIEEIIAKINTYYRRHTAQSQSILSYDDIEMNLITRQVKKAGKIIELRTKEFDLLKVFLTKPEEVLPRDFIFNQVWGYDFIGDSNVIEVYVRYLRTKLKNNDLIRTRRGIGYQFISENAQIKKHIIQQEF